MKIIYKSAIKMADLKARDKYKKVDGLEVHMFNEKEDFSNLQYTTKPIMNIHYPYCNGMCDLSNILKIFDKDEFQLFIDEVKDLNINIVLHNDMYAMEVLRHPKYFSFVKFLKANNISFLLENIPMQEKNNKDTTTDIPLICDDLNRKTNKECFFPLLDTCHVLMNLNTSVKNPGYDFSKLIRSYNSKKFFVHLSYCDGDGNQEEGRHALTFEKNKQLLEKLILELYSVNPNVNLVLEVNEENYLKLKNAENLKDDILIIKREYKLK